MNKIDKLIAGLSVLRSKATNICFYNSSGGSMYVDHAPLTEEEVEILSRLGWDVSTAFDSSNFDEGLVRDG